MSILPDSSLGWAVAAVAATVGYILYESDTSAAEADGNEGGGEEASCRVCYAGAEAGRLFSPCHCSGTMAHVHVKCLNEWRAASVNPRSVYTCDSCGYNYRTQRTAVAEMLQSERFVWLGSCVLMLLIIVIGSTVL